MAASTMATPGKPKSRSKSLSRAKAKLDAVDDEVEEEQEVVMPLKTPSRSRSKRVVKDEEEVDEEVVELRKSTRGRPKAKEKLKPKVATQPEPELELEVEEAEQPAVKPKAKPAVARKPSRAKSRPPPAPSPLESEEEKVSAAPPDVPKRTGTAPAKPRAGAEPQSKTLSSSTHITSKVRDVEVEVANVVTVMQEPNEESAGADEMDVFVSASSSSTQPQKKEELVLAPLYVPKRGGKPKEDDKKAEGREVSNYAGKSAPAKGKNKGIEQGQSQSQATRKPSPQAPAPEKEKAVEKGKERKGSSSMKIVEISTDEEGDNDPGDNDGIDLDLDSTSGKRKVTAKAKENSSNIQEKVKEKVVNVVDASAPVVSKPISSKPIVKDNNQMFVEIVQPMKTKATEQAPPSPSPSQSAEQDVEMAEVEIELESGIGHPPNEQPDITIERLPQTPPKRSPTSSSRLQLQKPQALPAPTHPTVVLPALSKLPFTPVENLTDAELDMTVEEWIRYQMGVEYDKFRRDGERELQQWVERAREVRAVIEAL